MNIHRFVVKNLTFDLLEQNHEILIEDEKVVWQIRKVLRLNNGALFKIFNGQGCEILAKIMKLDKKSLVAQVLSKEIFACPKPLIVGMPMIRMSRFEWAIEKLSEFGVTQIYPVILAYSQIDTSYSSQKWKRFNEICREATEQSGGIYLPKIYEPRELISFLEINTSINNDWGKYILDTNNKTPNMVNVLYNHGGNLGNGNIILVGSEGGFTVNELKLAHKHGFRAVGLGSRTLRVETAIISAVAFLKIFSQM